jgi:hypothetical protein
MKLNRDKAEDRVTRLGEFSNFEYIVYFGHFLKIPTEAARIFELPFSTVKITAKFLPKNVLG